MTVSAEADTASAAEFSRHLDVPTLVDTDNTLAAILGYGVLPNGYLFAGDGTLLDEVVAEFDIRDADIAALVRTWLGPDPASATRLHRPAASQRDPRAHTLFIEGEKRLARGDREGSLAYWHASFVSDPTSFVVRKQIWRALYPERFQEHIDTQWQREQLARERELGFADANPSLPPSAEKV